MATIFELSKEQAELEDALFWVDEDQDEKELIQDNINKIKGTAEHKLQWMTTILAEAMAHEEALKEAKKAIVETHNARINRAERRTDGLKKFMIEAMQRFQFKRIDGDYVSYTLCAPRKSLVYLDNFDIKSLPVGCANVKEIWYPVAKEIMAHLAAGEVLPGVYIKETPYLKAS